MRQRFVTLLVAGTVGAIFAAGLFIHGRAGGALLLLTDAVLIGLAFLTWRRLPPKGRPLRLVVIAVIAVLAAIKLIAG
jgi:hypothetical protein